MHYTPQQAHALSHQLQPHVRRIIRIPNGVPYLRCVPGAMQCAMYVHRYISYTSIIYTHGMNAPFAFTPSALSTAELNAHSVRQNIHGASYRTCIVSHLVCMVHRIAPACMHRGCVWCALPDVDYTAHMRLWLLLLCMCLLQCAVHVQGSYVLML